MKTLRSMQMCSAFVALAARDHTLAPMDFGTAMAHQAWRRVIEQRAKALAALQRLNSHTTTTKT